MNKGEKGYHKVNILEKVFENVDVVILTEVLFDATDFIFADVASMRLARTLVSRDMNKFIKN